MPHDPIPRVGRDTGTRWLVRDVASDAQTLTDTVNEAAVMGWDWTDTELIVDADEYRPGTLRLFFAASIKPRKPLKASGSEAP